jgi:hypothetical protein
MRQEPDIEATPAQPSLTAVEPSGGDRASDELVIADDLLPEDLLARPPYALGWTNGSSTPA